MASIVSLHGINMDPFEQLWSVIVSIESYSSDGGSFVTTLWGRLVKIEVWRRLCDPRDDTKSYGLSVSVVCLGEKCSATQGDSLATLIVRLRV